MANQCDDTFRRLQELEKKKRQLEADQADLHRAMAATQRELDDALANPAFDGFTDRLDGDELNEAVRQGFEQGRRTQIGKGDPNNYPQLLRQFGNVQTAEDYAALSRALLETGKEINPDGWRFLNESYTPEKMAELLTSAFEGLDDKKALLARMVSDSAPFAGLVERMTRLRVTSTAFKVGFRDALGKMAEHLETTNVEVPNGLKVDVLHRFKLALLAERHLDFARRRAGQTLRSLQTDLQGVPGVTADIPSADLNARLNGAFELPAEEIQGTLLIKADDLMPNSPTSMMAKVAKTLDEAKVNPKKAAKKLRDIQLMIDMDGLDPQGRFGKADWWNQQMKMANLLAKDSQLFNEATQLKTNLGSNVAMAIVGPYRQAFENQMLLKPYGTRFTREMTWDGWEAAWRGVKGAMDMVRVSGREVFNDALNKGVHHFAQNQDLIHKIMPVSEVGHHNQRVVAELKQLLDTPYQPWRGMKGPAAFVTPGNLSLMRGKLQASIRLWMFDRYGDRLPWLLQPGIRFLTAVDNVAGLYHYAFKVRNDLEMKFRMEGFDPRAPGVQKRIQQEFDRAFYSAAPDEAEIKAFRRQHALGAEVTDDEISSLIANEKLGQTYGAPRLDSEVARGAEAYSEEMRMQNRPTEGLAGRAWNSVQALRSRWEIDLLFPYFQSPIMGVATDYALSGFGPLVDVARWLHGAEFTPQQAARVKANAIIAGHLLAGFAAIETIDPNFIIGNGPVDPRERQEWLIDLEARGLKPNSIGGVPFLGGIPVLNTLFLFKDLKDAWFDGTQSKADQKTVLGGILQVMIGQLARQTSLGQLNQLMELMLDPTDPRKLRMLSYLGAGQIPGIGGIRTVERLGQSQPQDYYRSEEPGWEQRAAGKGLDGFAQVEQKLRSLAYGTVGLTGLLGGAKKEQDWLGSRINLPFGMTYADAVKHRFSPALWPDDKVYAELDAQNLLNPPRALMERKLEGVAMSDKLQKLYNDTYGEVKGDTSITARMKLAGKSASVTVKLPMKVDLPSGATVNADKTVTIPLIGMLEKHVQGKTALEAFRSLINDPMYRAMEEAQLTTADTRIYDQTSSERRGKAAQVMLSAVKDYYHLLTRDQLNTSNDPVAAAWRESRKAMTARRAEQFGGTLRDLVEAVNAAE